MEEDEQGHPPIADAYAFSVSSGALLSEAVPPLLGVSPPSQEQFRMEVASAIESTFSSAAAPGRVPRLIEATLRPSFTRLMDWCVRILQLPESQKRAALLWDPEYRVALRRREASVSGVVGHARGRDHVLSGTSNTTVRTLEFSCLREEGDCYLWRSPPCLWVSFAIR